MDYRSSNAHDYGYDYDYGRERERRPRTRRRSSPRGKPKAAVNVTNAEAAVVIIALVLVVIGLIMVFSAGYQTAATSVRFGNNAFHFVSRQLLFSVIGFTVMFAVSRMDYKWWQMAAIPFAGGTLGLIVFTFFFGDMVGGARRWIEIFGVRFQPSELAKPAAVLIVAFMASKFPGMFRNIKVRNGETFFEAASGIIVCMLFIAPIAGFIYASGGFSNTLLVVAVAASLIFIVSPYTKTLIALAGMGVAAVVGFLWWDANYGTGFRGQRFLAFQDPWLDPLGTGFQPIQSLYAVATGGWFGLGLGQSRQASYLPESHNDMIFAIIVEELGLVGASFILILFGIFVFYGVRIAMKAPDTFGSLTAMGIVFAIGLQAIVNVAVVTNSIPNTGVNLPFISSGGTSLVISLFLVGILLSISRYSRVEKK